MRIADIRVVFLFVVAAIFVAMLFLPRVQQFSDDSSRGFFTPVEAPADKPHLGCSVSSWDVGMLLPMRCDVAETSLNNGYVVGLRASFIYSKACRWIRLGNDALLITSYEGRRDTLLPDQIVIMALVRNKFYQRGSSPPPVPTLVKKNNMWPCGT